MLESLSRVVGRVVAVAALCAAAATAPAQVDLEPTVPTPDGRYRVGLAGTQFILYDNVQARAIMGGSTFPLVTNTPVVPRVEMIPKHYGADLVFNYANETADAQPLGSIVIAGIRLPGNSKVWNFGQDTRTATLPGFNYYGQLRYPQDHYSPLMVLGDDRHTLGISVLYPIVDYNHNVLFMLQGVQQATFGQPSQTWTLTCRFEGVIPAGASRTYIIAIRTTTADKSFLYTLTPYRDYFRTLYGPVDYTRDPRPVSGQVASSGAVVTPSNPRGYQNLAARPDVVGWRPTVNTLVNLRSVGFKRTMLWTASGCQDSSIGGVNFPYRFMTGLNDLPAIATTSLSEFARVRSAGMELGFWWGNNSTLMRGWNETQVLEGFDPHNPEHVALAYAEIDMAVAAGASMIGLDAYKQASPANMYTWMNMMRERAPNVKFVTENAISDYVHNLAPTFHEAHGIANPHILADFLNPGHETWAAIQTTPESRAANRYPTNPELLREMNRVAALGFVPLVYAAPNVRSSLLAAESWNRTVPRDLRMPMQPVGNQRLIRVHNNRRFGGGG